MELNARHLKACSNIERVKSFPYEGKGDHVVVDEVKTASAVAPMRGRGTALAVDEVPTRTPDFVVSLSIALDSRITANPIDALTRRRG